MSRHKRSWQAQKHNAAWHNHNGGTRTLHRSKSTRHGHTMGGKTTHGNLRYARPVANHNLAHRHNQRENPRQQLTVHANVSGSSTQTHHQILGLATSHKRPHAFRLQAEGREAAQRNGYIRGANEDTETGIAVSKVLAAVVFRHGDKVRNSGQARAIALRQRAENADVYNQVPEQAGTAGHGRVGADIGDVHRRNGAVCRSTESRPSRIFRLGVEGGGKADVSKDTESKLQKGEGTVRYRARPAPA